jgi:hypothetical protein
MTRVAAVRSAEATAGSSARLACSARKEVVAWVLFFTRWWSSASSVSRSSTARRRSSNASFASVMSKQEPK